MASARNRFLTLASLVILIFAAGELFGRRAGDLMGAVAHRVTFKLELLRARGSADFLVFGSSRGNDCAVPSAIGPALGLHGSSVANPSSSLPTLEYIAGRTVETPGLKLVLIELSKRQMTPDAVDLENAAPPDPSDPLGLALTERSALLKGRRAFAVENWPRLPALLFPSRYDGGEFFHYRWLAEAFAFPGPAAPGEVEAFVPANVEPGDVTDPDFTRVAEGYRRVADAFRARGVHVYLYGSPLIGHEDECTDDARRFRAAVAAHAAAPFDDFACVPVDRAWLTDESEHCGELGRARFGAVLAQRARRALP